MRSARVASALGVGLHNLFVCFVHPEQSGIFIEVSLATLWCSLATADSLSTQVQRRDKLDLVLLIHHVPESLATHEVFVDGDASSLVAIASGHLSCGVHLSETTSMDFDHVLDG